MYKTKVNSNIGTLQENYENKLFFLFSILLRVGKSVVIFYVLNVRIKGKNKNKIQDNPETKAHLN
jgi:hypothetical protein